MIRFYSADLVVQGSISSAFLNSFTPCIPQKKGSKLKGYRAEFQILQWWQTLLTLSQISHVPNSTQKTFALDSLFLSLPPELLPPLHLLLFRPLSWFSTSAQVFPFQFCLHGCWGLLSFFALTTFSSMATERIREENNIFWFFSLTDQLLLSKPLPQSSIFLYPLNPTILVFQQGRDWEIWHILDFNFCTKANH